MEVTESRGRASLLDRLQLRTSLLDRLNPANWKKRGRPHSLSSRSSERGKSPKRAPSSRSRQSYQTSPSSSRTPSPRPSTPISRCSTKSPSQRDPQPEEPMVMKDRLRRETPTLLKRMNLRRMERPRDRSSLDPDLDPPITKEERLTKRRCLGLSTVSSKNRPSVPNSGKPSSTCERGPSTRNQSDPRSLTPPHARISRSRSGGMSLLERLSISTKSYRRSTQRLGTIAMSPRSETSKLPQTRQSRHPKSSNHTVNGPSPGTRPRLPARTSCPTEILNLDAMEIISPNCSQHLGQLTTAGSSTMTKPYERLLPHAATSPSATIMNSKPSGSPTSITKDRDLANLRAKALKTRIPRPNQTRPNAVARSVAGTTPETAPEPVVGSISAISAGTLPTLSPTVPNCPRNDVPCDARKYLRSFKWTNEGRGVSPVVLSTETAPPLPSTPQSELDNEAASKTIKDNPHLFPIVTPINVDRFQELLRDHPNPAFTRSVCDGLHQGFWPWADTMDSTYPIIHNESH